MADFRKPKYSGSLNLAPECGPVLIELDTDAKTATASLEDPESQYTLAGGGGLDYVIPEQTVTISSSAGAGVQITENGLDDLQAGDQIILKMFYVSHNQHSYIGMSRLEGNTIEGGIPMLGIAIISNSNDKWYFKIDTQDQGFFPQELTISAIRGF